MPSEAKALKKRGVRQHFVLGGDGTQKGSCKGPRPEALPDGSSFVIREVRTRRTSRCNRSARSLEETEQLHCLRWAHGLTREVLVDVKPPAEHCFVWPEVGSVPLSAFPKRLTTTSIYWTGAHYMLFRTECSLEMLNAEPTGPQLRVRHSHEPLLWIRKVCQCFWLPNLCLFGELLKLRTEAQKAIEVAYVEATCNANAIGLVKLMGRSHTSMRHVHAR